MQSLDTDILLPLVLKGLKGVAQSITRLAQPRR